MNKEDPYRDQAEKLRQKIEKGNFEEGKMVEKEELPPRSRVHQRAKKNKWKLKYPVIRLLVLFFILLPITIFSIYSALGKDKIGNVKETIGESTEEFETVEIEKPEIPVTNEEDSVELEESDESTSNDVEGQTEGTSPELQQEGTVSAQTIAPSVNPKEKTVAYHKVKPGDTIYRISIKYYKSKSGIDTIKSANNLSSNEIRTGQVLTIPLNK